MVPQSDFPVKVNGQYEIEADMWTKVLAQEQRQTISLLTAQGGHTNRSTDRSTRHG